MTAGASYFPLALNVRGWRALMYGSGRDIANKARELAESGATVTRVVPPAATATPDDALEGAVRAEFDEAMLDGMQLVVAAVGEDRALGRRIYEACETRGILANVVDITDCCRFIYPARLRRGELTLTVSTGGASPALASMIRRELDAQFPAGFGEAVRLLGEYRRGMYLNEAMPIETRREIAQRMAAEAFKTRGGDVGDLAKRLCRIAREAGIADASSAATENSLNDFDSSDDAGVCAGSIALVGAGPGDPELITLAGVAALRQADLVIYDRLANPALLKHAPGAEHVFAGKEPGDAHDEEQRRIEMLMIESARAGRRVVRLKGGDPSLFAHGGEEVEAARAAGIPVRVVPGVTAALGAAAAAGFPLTQRDLASSVAFISGVGAGGELIEPERLHLIAQAVDTIVIYMGARGMAAIARALIEGGRADDEPAAIFLNATLPNAETRFSTLGALADVAGPEISAPAIIIVGAVAGFSVSACLRG